MEEIKKELQELSTRKTWEDEEEFDVNGFSGGNIDDAYYGGQKDGETNLAKRLLEILAKIKE